MPPNSVATLYARSCMYMYYVHKHVMSQKQTGGEGGGGGVIYVGCMKNYVDPSCSVILNT